MLYQINHFNDAIGLFLFVIYLYQVFYTVYAAIRHAKGRRRVSKPQADAPLHRFAAIICARNEENVITELIASLKAQDYPSEWLDIYVMADNCTDHTAAAARSAGAAVFERFNTERVGKGYALDDLFALLRRTYPTRAYDAFLVFDADNIVDAHFVSAMNETFCKGYDVITCYRNSKNFGANWISASYSIWFLRESRFLNYPRMLLGTNCAISGTGFLVSSRIIEENHGWPYYLLTEDIQFSAVCAMNNWRIGYCDQAIVYDEQPTSFRQSWRQRMRWSKGFYQVNGRYAAKLALGCFTGKRRFSCYDMLMTIAPCMLLTITALLVNLFFLFSFLTRPRFIAVYVCKVILGYIGMGILKAYAVLAAYALLTVITEWRRIVASPAKKLQYVLAFPIFMFTYIPISLAALVSKVEWKPIRHTSVERA